MTTPKEADMAIARQSRMVAVVFIVTILVWFIGQLIGAQVGLEARYALLLDLAALAAFVWGLVVTWQIWRKRRTEGSR